MARTKRLPGFVLSSLLLRLGGLMTAEPVFSGGVMSGVRGNVSVGFDRFQVPQVSAGAWEDAYFVEGYLHGFIGRPTLCDEELCRHQPPKILNDTVDESGHLHGWRGKGS